jgi:hypothetical protein
VTGSAAYLSGFQAPQEAKWPVFLQALLQYTSFERSQDLELEQRRFEYLHELIGMCINFFFFFLKWCREQ